jgi:Zn-dependent protease
VFAVPGRTLISKKPKKTRVFFIGPLISFLMGIGFFLMLNIQGFIGNMAQAGFTTAFIFAVYELIPISPMDGKEIWKRKKKAWITFFIPVFLIYLWFFLLG